MQCEGSARHDRTKCPRPTSKGNTFVLLIIAGEVYSMYPSIVPFTQVAGWDLANDNDTLKLHRSWRVKSFTKGLDFFQRVADIAESEGK